MMGELVDVAFGDIICVEGDCAIGESAVRQMQTTFEQLGRPPAHAATVAALVADFNAANSGWQRQIPFTTRCCVIKDIGRQAEQVTQAMLRGQGAAPPPPHGTSTPSPSDRFGGAAALLLAVVAAGAIAYAAAPAVAGSAVARRFRRRSS